MDIAALVETQKNLAKDRENTSERQVQQGFILLAKAEEEGFRNKTLLKKAAKIFLESIQRSKKNIEPYLGISYIFILVSNYEKAKQYLNYALTLVPEHPDVLKLLSYVERSTELEQDSALDFKVSATGTLSTQQYNELYDRVEFAIYTHLKMIMNSSTPAITVEQEAIDTLAAIHETLLNAHSTISEQMTILDQEFDINELQQKLKPLELSLHRYEKILRISKVFYQVDQEIKVSFAEVSDLLAKVEQGGQLDKLDATLETLLDTCDKFADQLDHLEQKGYEIKILENSYQQLLDQVELLQNAIEER